VVLGATGLQVFILSILEFFFRRKANNWLIVLHSEVEGVDGQPGVMKKIAKLALRQLGFPRYSKAVVLGSHILEGLKTKGIKNSNIIAVEHPIPERKYPDITYTPKENKVRVAVVGLLRGDTKDLKIAAELAKQHDIDISFIGRKGPGYRSEKGVKEVVTESHYSNEWIEDKLLDVDLLLLCPAQSKYKFTALGSVTDALVYGKPACWIRHSALIKYEDAPFVLCAKNITDLIDKIKTLEVGKQEEIIHWVRNWNKPAKKLIQLFLNNEKIDA
jgi:hypothetical protein